MNKLNKNTDIEDYILYNRSCLCILTPCYGNQITCNYTICMTQTLQYFKELNIPISVEFCRNDSLITRARNNLLARAMNNHDNTHFIFIDSDISWNPSDILKLMMSGKDLIGGVYPLKKYNWNKVFNESNNSIHDMINRKNNCEYISSMGNEEVLRYNMLNYNVNYISNHLNITDNILEVKHLATGFMMMTRNCVTLLHYHYPSTKYTDDVGFLQNEENDYAYALFNTAVEDGHFLSEDWYFCNRWTDIVQKVYVDVSINLSHIGIEEFHGSFITSLLINTDLKSK